MSQRHLEIFNPGANVAGLSSFTRFPSLPAEIRVSIWTWALRHQRIIQVYLRLHVRLRANHTRNGIDFPPLEPREDHPSYYPVIDGRRLLSKLLRVNAESRGVALSFHRVHLPCWLTGREVNSCFAPWTSGTVHINPEYDFLHIQQDKMDLVDFVWDLKTKHDPRNVGIRNLALSGIRLGGTDILDAIRPSEIEPSKMEIFKEIISGLDEVWLVSIQDCIRQHTGWQTNCKPFFERSFPIHATAQIFDRLGPDPRAVENDLGHLHIRDTRHLYDSWIQFLEKIEVKPSEERYRILIAFQPYQTIVDLRDAKDWLQFEDHRWTTKPGKRWLPGESDIKRVAASEHPEFRDEDLSKAVRPAFGFWLFPVDAFCDENKIEEQRGYVIPFDVRKHRPELVLLRLNEEETGSNVYRKRLTLRPP